VATFGAMTKKFVEEFLVDGALYHLLECGHIHNAVNTEPAMCPAPEQECERCGQGELTRLPN
jgi:hypothetical protein